MSKAIAFIFARGGSKGLPGKNIREFRGLPLIAHSISFALKSKKFFKVVVSTDSEEIAAVARAHGAEVPFMRPAELSTDESPEFLAWKHAITQCRIFYGDFDLFVSLPAVSPVRELKDLDNLWSLLSKKVAPDFVCSAVLSDANPYFNLIEPGDSGFKLSKPLGSAYRRQDCKSVYQIVPMYYAGQPGKILLSDSIFDGRLEVLEIPHERAFDVDTIKDFEKMERET